MQYHEYLKRATVDAVNAVFDYARAVPADKLEWKPLEGGRSVLDIAKELARTPVWAVAIIENRKFEWNEEVQKAEAEIEATFTSLEVCESVCREELDKFFAYITDFPEESLNEEVFLPFGKGKNYPIWDLMDYPRWNFSYHQGQIAYIQTLYGDREMY